MDSDTKLGVLKPLFVFRKTCNHFVKIGYSPVIGLHDIMCYMAASHWKAVSWKEVKFGDVIIICRWSE